MEQGLKDIARERGILVPDGREARAVGVMKTYFSKDAALELLRKKGAAEDEIAACSRSAVESMRGCQAAQRDETEVTQGSRIMCISGNVGRDAAPQRWRASLVSGGDTPNLGHRCRRARGEDDVDQLRDLRAEGVRRSRPTSPRELCVGWRIDGEAKETADGFREYWTVTVYGL